VDEAGRQRLGYVPALDGLRGIAILLVIGRHYWHIPHGGGGAGVNLFFVLSGFLITTLLLEERAATGRISLSGFYHRRARRLLPALAVLLVGYLAGAAAKGGFHEAGRAALAGAFYTANIAQAYWPHLIGGQPIGVLWSLSLEEQFYLVWPILLIAALRLGMGRRTIMALVAMLIVAGWGWRVWLTVQGASEARILASPDSHADALLAGVLLAFVLFVPRKRDEGLAVIALFLFGTVAVLGPIEALNGPWVDIGAFGVIFFAIQDGSWLGRALSWRPLVEIGLISYSLYLWHGVVLSWFGGSNRPIALAVAVAVAWLSYRFVERPFRRARSAKHGRRELGPAVLAAPSSTTS
jgi:peptidoglycan/LPS O-acetylase OafA/YrhL